MSWRKRRDRVPNHVFAALDRAEPLLVEHLGSHGVTGVEFVVGFVRPYSVWVWLVTAGDAERDQFELSKDLPLFDEIRGILTTAGLPARDAYFAGTTVQSQETVDRDYQGNWFYTLR